MPRHRDNPAPFANWLASADLEETACAPTNPNLPVLVVGAGPAGLAIMSALAEAAISFEAVEAHSGLGGIWNETNPVSSIYEGLHTVTSRHTTHLGTKPPDDWPDYPSHRQVLTYFEGFARDRGLLPHIRFGTRFESAVKTAEGTWQVTFRGRDGTRGPTERVFRAIVFATGAHNKLCRSFPNGLRDQALAEGIEVLHSADYSHPSRYAGKRVLVVGVGNSGSDIAEKISQEAKRVLISVRTPPWINPPTVWGVPCDKLAFDGTSLPDWLAMPIFHWARSRAIGSYRRLGMLAPRYGLNDRLPITDRGIVQAIRAGRVIVRSHVQEFRSGEVHFADKRQASEGVDVVIFATGYQRHYPLLTDTDAANGSLLFHLFHRREPGLVYMMETIGLRCCWPIFLEQARCVAAYFNAENVASDRVAAFNSRRHAAVPPPKGKLFRLADSYHLDYDAYTQLLRGLTQWLTHVSSTS